MPCSYVIDVNKKLVLSTGWDTLTNADLQEHQDKLSKDPNFHPDFFQLSDFTDVKQLMVDSHIIVALAARTLYSANSRRAIVAPNALIFGLSRMFSTYREIAKGEEQIRVFDNRSAALQWLEHGDK